MSQKNFAVYKQIIFCGYLIFGLNRSFVPAYIGHLNFRPWSY